MPRPYSEDLRLRVVKAVEGGIATREIGAIFQVSPSFVASVHQRWQQTGGYRRALLEPYEAALSEQLSNSPSMTLKDMQAC